MAHDQRLHLQNTTLQPKAADAVKKRRKLKETVLENKMPRARICLRTSLPTLNSGKGDELLETIRVSLQQSSLFHEGQTRAASRNATVKEQPEITLLYSMLAPANGQILHLFF